MKETIKKTLLSGIGMFALAKERAETVIKEWVEKGELSEKEGRELLDEVLKRSEEARKKLESKIENEIRKIMDKMNLATKEEIQQLEQRINELEAKLPRDPDATPKQ